MPDILSQNEALNEIVRLIPTISSGGVGGDASAANQVIANTKLDSVINNTNVQFGGGAITATTQRVTLATDGPAVASLTNIDTKTPSLGQALAAASTPVVLPAAQITALTPPSAIIGFNLETTQALVKAKTDNLDVLLSTRLKPADTLAGVTTVGAVTAITNALPTGTNSIGQVTANAGTNLNTSALALETGGNLTSINTKIPSNLTVTANRLNVDASGVTQPISASTLPLPVNASTSTLQTTGNTSLSSIDGKLTPSSITSTGTLSAAAQTVSLALTEESAANVQIGGTWVGTILFEATLDGTTFFPINAVSSSTSSPQSTTTVNGLYRLTPAGTLSFRVNMTAYTSGTATISMRATKGTGGVFANQILPVKIDQTTPGTTNKVNIGTDGQVATNGTVFAFSGIGINSTTTQLAASATFTGVVESIVNQQSYSILFFSDQNATIRVNQFIDAGGTKNISQFTFTYLAGTRFARSGVANGNFLQVIVQNTGGSTTTTLQLDTAYGTIPSATQLNNSPQALNEINGTVIDTNTGASSAGTQRVVLANESVQDLYVIGQSAQTAIINNILTTTAGAAATDLLGYRSFAVQINSTGTGGTFIFEESNDNVNFNTILIFDDSQSSGAGILGAITASAVNRMYVGAILGRYFRVRIATTITGGSIQAFSRFSQIPYTRSTTSVVQSSAANLNANIGTVTTVSTVSSVTAAQLAINAQAVDVASAAITTTANSATITPTAGISYEVNIPVTVVTGTAPTLQVTVQESDDTATNWVDVYTFPTITATGTYRSPLLPLTGNKIRYVQTVGGTTPSFTRQINRIQSNNPANVIIKVPSLSSSSTITTGGVAQTLLAANTARNGFELQNTSANDLFFSFGSTASATNGFKLPSNATYSTPSIMVSISLVSIFGATTGQSFTVLSY